MARLILLFLLLPFCALAQNGTITGKIISTETKVPIAHASVFLSNSAIGTSTTADGSFILKGLKPGQYTLIVNLLGFEDNAQVVFVKADAIKLTIEMVSKPIELREVTISNISKADKKQALDFFKTEFIGDDENAAECKISNPDVLNFTFHQNKNILQVSTDDFLIVENHALGYRIKFLIKNFTADKLTGNMVYKGDRYFEELDGKDTQKKKWYKKRDEAYYGSAMHFYRTLYKDSIAGSGFKIYRLLRQPNPDRPSDAEIQENLSKAKDDADTYTFWTNIKQLPRFGKQSLAANPWSVKDIVRKTDHPDLRALVFPDYLYIVYTNKWETGYLKDVYRAPNNLNYPTTIISFVGNNNYIAFDANGARVGASPLYEGSWANARLSAMLPVDYTPYNKP